MQCCGFSLPLTMATLVTYIILFFAPGYNKDKDIIAIGHLFYLDKPQGTLSKARGESLFVAIELIFSSRSKATDRFVDRILDLVVVENEDHQPCLVSYFRTFSKDVQVSVAKLDAGVHEQELRCSRLFVLPFYESAIVEQNLLLNKQEKDEMSMNGKEPIAT